MGEVMVTVCRSEKLAGKMTSFLEEARKELGPILDAGPYLGRSCTDWDDWFWQASSFTFTDTNKGCRIYSSHTHFTGVWRCANFAMHRFAALKVGRKRSKFPDEMTSSFPVPYIRYGDFENWPVFSAKDAKKLKSKKYIKRVSWTFVKDNGMQVDPASSQYYLGVFNPNQMDIYKQLEKEGSEPGPYRWDRLEELSRPWCTEVLKPLDEFMTDLSRRWDER